MFTNRVRHAIHCSGFAQSAFTQGGARYLLSRRDTVPSLSKCVSQKKAEETFIQDHILQLLNYKVQNVLSKGSAGFHGMM